MDTAQLSGRELDKTIAEKLFGIKKIFQPGEYPRGDMYFGSCNEYAYIPSGKSPRTHMIDAAPIPYFSTSIEAAMQVEDRIAELGLQKHYLQALGSIVSKRATAAGEILGYWHFTHACAEDRCRAALRAIDS